MSEFSLYLQLGIDHILDVKGYDHILFVVALCTIYTISDWKKLLIMVTAFTLGHSVTLALATFQLVRFNSDIIEFLIPVTIFVTAFFNILRGSRQFSYRGFDQNYLFALFFGLVHGLGFSNYLIRLLGKDTSILTQLFAFNIGLEIGQIIIVAIFMTSSFIFVDLFNTNQRDWRLVISSAVAGIALTIMIETKFW
ncbi:MAG: HupE/UreJ family protein [Bacteroidetes bacterium]|nr:HupE/UreJ family protein [Bacteroidota bacterium]MCZ6694428.1 HupE/UreJ family protein [Bacteroidota bacterium]MCZ6898620.1 HupE/UreJ family protein [Bacteroidota bacterium]